MPLGTGQEVCELTIDRARKITGPVLAFLALPCALCYLCVRIRSPVPSGLFSLSATSDLPPGG